MKKLIALLLTLAVLFSVTSCGKKSVCPMCSAEADFSTQVFCSSCGYNFGSMKPDGYYEEQLTPEEQAIYELEGVWQTSDWWEVFCESGIYSREFYFFFPDQTGLFYGRYSDYNEFIPFSYSVKNNILTLSDKSGEWVEEALFNYKIENGILSLDEETYTRMSTYNNNELFGTWALISTGSIRLGYSTYTIGTIDFYKDGTYQFNKGVESSDPIYANQSGYYQIIHDGSAIVFDGNTEEPYPFTLLGNGVMIITNTHSAEDLLFVCTSMN